MGLILLDMRISTRTDHHGNARKQNKLKSDECVGDDDWRTIASINRFTLCSPRITATTWRYGTILGMLNALIASSILLQIALGTSLKETTIITNSSRSLKPSSRPNSIVGLTQLIW